MHARNYKCDEITLTKNEFDLFLIQFHVLVCIIPIRQILAPNITNPQIVPRVQDFSAYSDTVTVTHSYSDTFLAHIGSTI